MSASSYTQTSCRPRMDFPYVPRQEDVFIIREDFTARMKNYDGFKTERIIKHI